MSYISLLPDQSAIFGYFRCTSCGNRVRRGRRCASCGYMANTRQISVACGSCDNEFMLQGENIAYFSHLRSDHPGGEYLCPDCFSFDDAISCNGCSGTGLVRVSNFYEVDSSVTARIKHYCPYCSTVKGHRVATASCSVKGCNNIVRMDSPYGVRHIPILNSDGVFVDADKKKPVCEACATGVLFIAGYSYLPTLHFYGKPSDGVFLGTEVEIESPRSSPDIVLSELSVHSLGKSVFYNKSDSSLRNGFELVSHPCSVGYHQNSYPWKGILDILKRRECTADSAPTAGMHVHMTKKPFSYPDQIKMGLFIHSSKKDIEQFSRRSNKGYATFKPLSAMDFASPDEKLCKNENRHDAINFQKKRTIEFRMFQSTMIPEVLMGNLEFCHCLGRFVKKFSLKNFSSRAAEKGGLWAQFKAYAAEKGYGNLVDCIKANKIIHTR